MSAAAPSWCRTLSIAALWVLGVVAVLPAVGLADAAQEGPHGPWHGLVASDVVGLRDGAPAAREPAAQRDREVTSAWGWPLAGVPPITRGFDPPEHRWSSGHRGIDLLGVAGEPVLAVDAGVVTHSGVIAGVGVLSVTHASGLRSTYQPVTDRAARGERVSRGAAIGRLEPGHCVMVECLHLGAVRGRDGYVDPTPLLLGVELTLRPVQAQARG